jgi:hypothetical protein
MEVYPRAGILMDKPSNYGLANRLSSCYDMNEYFFVHSLLGEAYTLIKKGGDGCP